MLLASCGGPKTETTTTTTTVTTTTSSTTPSTMAATYTPRVGIAVSTPSRTCVAIANSNLEANSAITLVAPIVPQTFVQAQVGGISQTPCPVSKNVDPATHSYDITIPKGAAIPKLLPLIAVVGPSASFSTAANNGVQSDVDQDGKPETFRACSATDGVHLTMWNGDPLTGTLLWHGYYYEPGNPAVGPACTSKDTTAL